VTKFYDEVLEEEEQAETPLSREERLAELRAEKAKTVEDRVRAKCTPRKPMNRYGL
jgi:hypothetical protein